MVVWIGQKQITSSGTVNNVRFFNEIGICNSIFQSQTCSLGMFIRSIDI